MSIYTEETSILVAMVARVFVATLLPWDDYLQKNRTYNGTELGSLMSLQNQPLLDSTILLTTDADLWPISANMYHFPRGTHAFYFCINEEILLAYGDILEQ